MSLRWPAGVAVLLAAAGGAWFAWRAAQTRGTSAGAPSSAETATTGRMVVLALTAAPAGAQTGAPRVTLPPDTGTLRLVLPLPPRSVRSWLSAALKTATGAPVWRGDVVAPDRTPTVVADLPARRITGGDYRLALRRAGSRGFEEIATYPFTVVRE